MSLMDQALPYKDRWISLTKQEIIKVGNRQIRKNNHGNTTNSIIDAVNFIPEVIGNTSRNTQAQFITSNGSTLTTIVDSTLKGRWGIDIGNMSSAQGIMDTVTTLGGNLFSGLGAPTGDDPAATPFNIGGALGLDKGLGNTIGTAASDAAKAVGNATAVMSKSVSGYIAAVSETIEKINQIGDAFDEIIKDTFLGQVFKIKGTELLCTMFCIIISLLPCDVRQQMYETVMDIKMGLRTAQAVIDGVNQITATPVEIPISADATIADSVKKLFTKRNSSPTKIVIPIPEGTGYKRPSITLEIPPNVTSTIRNITMVLGILAKGQITIPTGINSTIWDLAQVILSVIQIMVAQAADEFMTKVVKEVEAQMRKIVPQICVGNLASIFINKITQALFLLKDFLVEQIKQMFGDSKGFELKWKKFGWYFKEIQDLLAMLKALDLVLKNFPDLALLCGIQPCNEAMTSEQIRDIQDAVRNGMLITQTNYPAKILPYDQTPQGRTLDDIAGTFNKMTGTEVKLLPSDQGFDVVMPQIYRDAPRQIRDIINSPEFLNELGNAYTVYASPDVPFVNVVYTYKLSCGDK